MEDLQMKTRKALLGMLVIFALAAPRQAHGQFLGYVAGQIVTKNISLAVPVNAQTVSLQNFGQMGHTVHYVWNSASSCYFKFQASQDNVNWNTLAIGIATGTTTPTYLVANGYFPFLRLNVNPNNGGGCNGNAFNGTYAGYQQPPPITRVAINTGISSNGTIAGIFTPPNPNGAPFLVMGFSCSNTAGAVGFLEVFDNDTAPALGAGSFFEVGIPAGQTYVYPGPDIFFQKGLWFGQATALDGAVALAGIRCNFQYNRTGPFYPLAPFDIP
jgi:hypothetical protein